MSVKILIFILFILSAVNSFSQNRCVDLFSLNSQVRTQSQIDALVLLHFQIEHKDFQNDNQYRQAIENFQQSLKSLISTDPNNLQIFKSQVATKREAFTKQAIIRDKEKSITTAERNESLKKHIVFNPTLMQNLSNRFGGHYPEFSPDSKYIIFRNETEARFYETASLKEVNLIPSLYKTDKFKFNTAGTHIAIKRAFSVDIFDIKKGTQINFIENGIDFIYEAAFSPDGKYILIKTTRDRSIIYDISSKNKIFEFKSTSEYIFSRDSQYVTTILDNVVKIFSIPLKKQISKVQHENNATALDFSHDGKYILTYSDDKTLKVTEVISQKEIFKIQHDLNNKAEFHINGHDIIYSTKTFVNLQNFKTKDAPVVILENDRKLFSAKLSQSGEYTMVLSSKDAKGTVKVFRTATQEEIFNEQYEDYAEYVQMSNNGKYMSVSLTNDKVIFYKMHNALEGE